jgi:hypothetical protein
MSDSTLSSDEGAISYALLGILLMLDITFICNYYVIKALRSWTDAFTKEDPPDISKPVRPQSKISQHLETFLFGCILGKVRATSKRIFLFIILFFEQESSLTR